MTSYYAGAGVFAELSGPSSFRIYKRIFGQIDIEMMNKMLLAGQMEIEMEGQNGSKTRASFTLSIPVIFFTCGRRAGMSMAVTSTADPSWHHKGGAGSLTIEKSRSKR